MRRRDLLGAVAAGLPGGALVRVPSVGAAPAQVGDPQGFDAPPVLVHTRQGHWVVGPTFEHLLPAGAPPVVVPGGLWSADGPVLRHARPAGGPASTVVRSTTLDTTAHGLLASADGGHVLAAHGGVLSLFDDQARLLRRWRAPAHGDAGARPRTLFAHASRRSLIAAWPAQRELWEIQLDPQAPPIHDGLVHDWRLGEALPTPGHLGVRRIRLDGAMPALRFADARVPWLAGHGEAGVHIVHLDVRGQIVTLPLHGAEPGAAVLAPGPHPAWWLPQGERLLHVDPVRWRVVGQRILPGPVHAMAVNGAHVLAWAGDTLQHWRDGDWRPLAWAGARPRALGRDVAAGHWLLASEAPAALWRLDAEGRVLTRRAWPLAAQALALTALRA